MRGFADLHQERAVGRQLDQVDDICWCPGQNAAPTLDTKELIVRPGVLGGPWK